MRKNLALSTRQIAFAGVLSALNIVVNAFKLPLGSYAISFTYTTSFIAGFFFGPVVGLLVGGVGDTIGCLIRAGAPNPLILLGSMLYGLIPGLIQLISHKLPSIKKPWDGVTWTLSSYAVCFVLVTMFWNSFAIWLISPGGKVAGIPFLAFMIGRLATQSIVWALNLALSLFLYPLLVSALHINPTNLVDIVKRARREKPMPSSAVAEGSTCIATEPDPLSPASNGDMDTTN